MAVFIGIDVAKRTLAVAVRPGQESFQVSNDAAGHRALVTRLQAWPIERIVLEASGGYERALLAVLSRQWPVVRIPPQHARAFAKAMGRCGGPGASGAGHRSGTGAGGHAAAAAAAGAGRTACPVGAAPGR